MKKYIYYIFILYFGNIYSQTETENLKVFLSGRELYPIGLVQTQMETQDLNKNKAGVVIWKNFDDKGLFKQVTDIRWIFNDTAEAKEFHASHLKVNSEYSKEITAPEAKKVGQELHVFIRGKDDPMIALLNADIVMYYFIFRVNKVVAKILIYGNSNLNVDRAIEIAEKAEQRIRMVAG